MHSELWQQFSGLTIDGRYHLSALIGAGAHGGTFAAEHLTEDGVSRRVAIKLMIRDSLRYDQQLKDLTVYAGLSSPSLVRSFAPGTCDLNGIRLIYLPSELADAPLNSRLPDYPLNLDESRDVGICIATALSYLHGLPVPLVHRDIKPDNIVITGGRWKVADFGLMRAVAAKEGVRTRTFVGTAEYAPPEAFDGLITPAWDIWSLGVTLYEAATGRLPFHGETPQQLMRAICNEPPVLDAALEPGLKAIIEACLAKTLADRPTAEQALEKLEQLDNGMANWRYEQEKAPEPSRRRQSVASVADTPIHSHGISEPDIVPTETSILVAPDGSTGVFTIQEAIDRTLPGGHVCLLPGVYRGGVTIKRSVTLFCELDETGPKARIETTGEPAITITGRDVRISGIEAISRPDTQQTRHDAVAVVGAHAAQLDACLVSGGSLAAVGVRAEGSQLTLIKCTVTGGRSAGLELEAGTSANLIASHIAHNGGSGIHCLTSARLTLHDCDVYTSHESGLVLDKSAHAEIVSCGFYSNEGSGITLTEAAEAHISGSAIYENNQTGISLRGRCRAELTHCDITRNVLTGAAIAGGAAVVFRECKVHDSRSNGISISDGSRCELLQCDVSSNGFAGLKLSHGGELTADTCTFKDGRRSGLDVQDGGLAHLTSCIFERNLLAGMLIEEGGHVDARNCQFIAGHEQGINCSGMAKLMSCEISENAGAGIEVLRGGAPTLQRCTLSGNHQPAILVREGSEAVVESCTISRCPLPAVAVGEGSKVLLSASTLSDGDQVGVAFWDHARGIIDDCSITGFKLDAVRLMDGCSISINKSRLTGCGEYALRASGACSGDVAHSDLSGCGLGAGHVEAGCEFASASNKVV